MSPSTGKAAKPAAVIIRPAIFKRSAVFAGELIAADIHRMTCLMGLKLARSRTIGKVEHQRGTSEWIPGSAGMTRSERSRLRRHALAARLLGLLEALQLLAEIARDGRGEPD